MKYYRDLPKPVPVRVTERPDKLFLSAPYHDEMARAARGLGGTFSAGTWTFPGSIASEARRLIHRCFGEGDPTSTDELVTARVRANRAIAMRKAQIIFAHRVIVAARGRDSGAQPGHNVSLLDGEIHSGGSVANWCTCVEEGSEFEVRNLPRSLAKSNDKFEVFAINGDDVEDASASARSALEARRTALLAELEDIEGELKIQLG